MTFDREQISRDLKIVEGTDEGRRVIGYLLQFTHIHQSSYFPKHGTDMLLFNEGQRSVGNEIVALLYNEPQSFRAVQKAADLAEGK
ncbi:Bbp19 family protein [Nitratireductor indicus]|uniref:Bbp19 family protein n=1 Tax=Nitratireductor indicus TaxID=721133 RepID=UPI002873F4C0|nr:hypothetical protein [Nitratireductor indicus]MDS1138585.1 hypothetical protein [Nitratireductor indicus]